MTITATINGGLDLSSLRRGDGEEPCAACGLEQVPGTSWVKCDDGRTYCAACGEGRPYFGGRKYQPAPERKAATIAVRTAAAMSAAELLTT